MAAVLGSAGYLDHHFGRSPNNPSELRIGRRITRSPRRTQHRLSDARPTHIDGRTQRLLEPERSAQVAHGSVDQ